MSDEKSFKGEFGGWTLGSDIPEHPTADLQVTGGDGTVRIYQLSPDHPLAQQFPLDNRGPKVCGVCGENESALLSYGVSWLCTDALACDRRFAQKMMKALRKEDPSFGMASSLPPDPLHPTGRCTCGGEGRCAWCQEVCACCGGIGVSDEPWYSCEECNGTGYADGLELPAEGRAAKIEAIRAGDVDYEALGYPETKIEETDLNNPFWLAAHVGNLSGEWAASMVRIFEKDIPGATDNG